MANYTGFETTADYFVTETNPPPAGLDYFSDPTTYNPIVAQAIITSGA